MRGHDTFESSLESHHLDGQLWLRGRNVILFIGLLAWIACAAGFILERKQFHVSYLVGYLFSTTIALGALFFVMVMFLTGSAWSVTMRRFGENLAVTLPAAAALFLPIAFGLHDLYEWTHEDLGAKSGYLNTKFFLIRAAAYLLIWSVVALAIRRHSTRQDKTRNIECMHSASRWSAPGLLLCMVTVTLASFDWIMSLDPHWYSTIFGIYVYAGGGLASFALLTLICLAFRRKGVLEHSIHVEHYHDLGKWMFALTVFWTYIAFSQYLLIWYANIPEETLFFLHRLEGSWKYVSAALLLGHFVLPFFVLLPRASKRNFRILQAAAVWLLAMHYIDLYWLVVPNFQKHGVHFHWLDLASVLAVGSVFAYVFWARLRRNALIPVGDLRLEEAYAHHNV